MLKFATIYLYGDSLYFHPLSETTQGGWIATGPFIKVKSECIAIAKGKFALEVLEASREAIPHPASAECHEAPLLELAGQKSLETFWSESKRLSLDVEGDLLKVVPVAKYNPSIGRGGIGYNPDQIIELPRNASAREIGLAIEEALRRCE